MAWHRHMPRCFYSRNRSTENAIMRPTMLFSARPPVQFICIYVTIEAAMASMMLHVNHQHKVGETGDGWYEYNVIRPYAIIMNVQCPEQCHDYDNVMSRLKAVVWLVKRLTVSDFSTLCIKIIYDDSNRNYLSKYLRLHSRQNFDYTTFY